MASIIRVKRSTGTSAPGSLNFGELGLTVGVGTNGNLGGRLFAGDNASNPQVVGGRYYTDLLSIGPGLVAGQSNPTTASNGFVAIVDQSGKVDQWNVDNLRLDGNTVSSTNSNGDVVIDPNGTGDLTLTGGTSQTFNINDGSTNRFVVDTTNGSTTITQGSLSSDNPILNATGTWNNSGIDFNAIKVNITNTQSTSNSKLIDLQIGGSSKFVVSSAGFGTFASNLAVKGTENAVSATSGALTVAGGAGISSDLYVGGNLYLTTNQTITGNLTVQGNTTLGNGVGDLLSVTGITTFAGNITQTGQFVNYGGAFIDGVGISSNVISTRSGTGNILYIDPYPDGLSNQGTVVIKGDLQVDGTTTTINSSTVSANETIFNLGDITSIRTIVATVSSGVSTISLDSVVGINTGDIISGPNGLPTTSADRTVTAYNPTSKVITIQGATTAGISTTTQLTVQHYYDTNTDRGISFEYNTSSGVANYKKGFFGFKDSNGYFTFIPDATFTNSVVTGTKGTLDIGAILLNFTTSGISTRGSSYFDSTGKLTSTNSPEIGYASTSNYVLTTNASNVPVWTDTLDGGTF